MFSPLELFAQSNTINCICIDPGHGGKDPGANTHRVKEKNIVLSIALKVGKLIKAQNPDVRVLFTRTKDVFVPLRERTAFANRNKVDLFISIHADAVSGSSAHGIGTFVLGNNSSKQILRVAMKENSVIEYEDNYKINYGNFDPNSPESYIIFNLIKNIHLEKSLKIASYIQHEFSSFTKLSNRDVRQAPYWVLKDVSMPSLLIETGFITNSSDQRYINSSKGQYAIAKGIAAGFLKYRKHLETNTSLLKYEKVRKGLYYAVQIASSVSEKENMKRFNVSDKIDIIESGNRFKYIVGHCTSTNEALILLRKLKENVKDCFLIAVNNGKVISLSEAKELFNN